MRKMRWPRGSSSLKRRPAARPHHFFEVLEDRRLLAQTTGLFFNDPGASHGYTLFSPNTSNTTYLIDKDAHVVNEWTSDYAPGLLGYLMPDGSLLRASAPHGQGGNGSIQAAGAGGLLERFDWNGTKTWEFAYDSATHLSHHDLEVMPNGNILLIAWELKSEAEATQAGRDPNLPGPGFLYPDHIIEVQPDYVNGGGTIVWEWYVWDHLVQEFDPTKDNYYGPTGVEDHPELIDINFVSVFDDGAGEPEDWTHANGIDYNAELDQIVLSVREFSEFWIIDHSTTTAEAAGHTGGNSGMGGDLLYRWGNPQAYDRGDASDRVLFYQHDAKWVEDGDPGEGNITVLNNGFGRPGTDFTTVEEITPPEDGFNYTLDTGQPYGPASTVWTYTAPLDDFSSIISGTQRLPNGNTLITYGVDGTFVEVTPAEEVVWKYVNPYAFNTQLGPEATIPSMGLSGEGLEDLLVNFTFRAIDYPAEYLAQFTVDLVGRSVFYNNSTFDGNTTGIDASDDAAIAPDKSAYLPGSGVATFDNITSYSRGINGIMVDLANPPGEITVDDFAFKMSTQVGANNTPSTWQAAPAPLAVSVRPGEGTSGTDRVVIIWADGAIANRWLEVTVKGNDVVGGFNTDTGLLESDVFYFGNRIGDTGSGTPNLAITSATDEIAARNNPGFGAAITNLFDFDRNGLVSAVDQIASRNNVGLLTKINITDPPASPLAADQSSLIAAGLAAALSPALLEQAGSASRGESPRIAVAEDLHGDDDAFPALLEVDLEALGTEGGAVETALDDELLDALLEL